MCFDKGVLKSLRIASEYTSTYFFFFFFFLGTKAGVKDE